MQLAIKNPEQDAASHYQFTPEQREKYKTEGFLVVDDFLPEDIASRIFDIWDGVEDWNQIDQVREKHYQHVFKTDNPYLPREDEFYMAKFDRCERLEGDEEFSELFKTYFRASMIDLSEHPLTEHDIRCYRLKEGDFYRSHIDDYAGQIGCIYYINKRWVWDWGGILHVSTDEIDRIDSMLPKYNSVVFLNHGGFRFPHFISEVSRWAKNPRYTMVSFNS